MHITSTPCQETLFLLTTSSEDEGNYTCVATNKFGEVNSTKEIKIIGKSSFMVQKMKQKNALLLTFSNIDNWIFVLLQAIVVPMSVL